MNIEIIEQWKRDLTDPEFPVFNMEYEVIPSTVREYAGDPGLFIAFRYADIPNLISWMDGRRTYEIVSEYTAIPLKDAAMLLDPPDGEHVEYSRITAKSFVEVLDLYLHTGKVHWPRHMLRGIPVRKRLRRRSKNG